MQFQLDELRAVKGLWSRSNSLRKPRFSLAGAGFSFVWAGSLRGALARAGEGLDVDRGDRGGAPGAGGGETSRLQIGDVLLDLGLDEAD
jgi:hypothetical protein